MTTQITIVSPNQADKAVGVTVQQWQATEGGGGAPASWVDVKPTVVLQPGASMSEYIHRTQRVVIGELELVVPVEAPALDAVAEGAEPNPAPEAEPVSPEFSAFIDKVDEAGQALGAAPAPESNGVGDTEGVR